MASVNKVMIMGRLGRDPEISYLKDGETCHAALSIATDNRQKDATTGEWKNVPEWHRVSLMGKSAEVARDYLKKGSTCYIEGRLRTRSYTDKQGVEKWVTEIIGNSVMLCDKREDGQQSQQQARPAQNGYSGGGVI